MLMTSVFAVVGVLLLALQVEAQTPTQAPSAVPSSASYFQYTFFTVGGKDCIDPAGCVVGFEDGVNLDSEFASPYGIAVDNVNFDIYVADTGNQAIRKGHLNATSGEFTWQTCGGNGVASMSKGIGRAASFNYPTSIAADSNQNLFVADMGNSAIRKGLYLSGQFNWETIGGTNCTSEGCTPGLVDGEGTSASFTNPSGISVDSNGSIYITEMGSHSVRKGVPYGSTYSYSVIGGNCTDSVCTAGLLDGPSTESAFNQPAHIAVDYLGSLYVTDLGNNAIRLGTPLGNTYTWSTIGGLGCQTTGCMALWWDGFPGSSGFNAPVGITVDTSLMVFVSDFNNNAIRQGTPLGDGTYQWATTAGYNCGWFTGCTAGYVDATGTEAKFNSPMGIANLGDGTLLLVEAGSSSVRIGTTTAPTAQPTTIAPTNDPTFMPTTAAGAPSQEPTMTPSTTAPTSQFIALAQSVYDPSSAPTSGVVLNTLDYSLIAVSAGLVVALAVVVVLWTTSSSAAAAAQTKVSTPHEAAPLLTAKV